MNGASQLLDIIRIDEQRIGELQSCARKGAEDQDALIIFARRDELLGDKIHPVVQGSNQTQRSGAIEASDFLVRMMALEKDDGLPAAGLEAGVDAFGFGGELAEQILVAVNVGAAGRADLDKGKAALVRRIKLEEEFDGAEALENAFGVVNAIDANSNERGADAELIAQRGALLVHTAMRLQRIAVFLKTDADGVRTHARQMALASHREAVPFRERFDGAIDSGKKIVAVRLNVKADKVGTEQTVDQFTLPRTNPEDLRIRPRNVPENRNTGVGPRFLDHARKQCEMIILHQNNG